MSFLFVLHSWLRWLIMVVAVIAVVRFAMGLARRDPYDRMSSGLLAAYTGLFDLQVLLGIIYLLWSGLAGEGFPLYRIEHALGMIVAAVVAHLAARWKRAPDATRYRAGVIVIVVSLALVFLSVLFLPGGPARLTLFRGF